MSFPRDIAERALLDCGRHCCICHVFCGFKIELHHIIQKGDDGDNSYENCIPLCLNCHAEVKAYDSRHPKGRKYTESELIGHRDRWYGKINGSGCLIASEQKYLDMDRNFFGTICNILPYEGSISFIRFKDFGNRFKLDDIEQLHNFINQCNYNPGFEFIDADMEGLKANLFLNIESFLSSLGSNIFSIDGRPGFYGVPKEWSYNNLERWQDAVREINQAAEKVCEVYDNLVKLCRRKLGI